MYLLYNYEILDFSRYSTASSVASFLSRHSDMLSTPNGSDVEYNFSSDSDDDSYQPGQDIDDIDLSLLEAVTHDPVPNAAFEDDSEHFSHDDEEDGDENNDEDGNDTDPDGMFILT